MPPPPPPPPDLPDDAISEILLRLPPDEPRWLFRAALVCKPWLRTLSDPAFLRRYRDFHGAPPLLGLVNGEAKIEAGQDPCFVPTTAAPAFSIPEPGDAPYAWPLDCRHDRVLLSVFKYGSAHYLVCDPVMGDRHRVPLAVITSWTFTCSAVVFCAADGCGHLDCHSGPFCLVFLFTDDVAGPTCTMSAAMYSSEIGAWRAPVTLDDVPHGTYSRGPLIGDEIYFALPEAATIVKYDWANNFLSVVNPPLPALHEDFVLMVMEDHSLGLAAIVEDTRLHAWSRRVTSEGTAEWVQSRVIDLEKKMPMAFPSEFEFTTVVGFAEGVGIIFVSTTVGLFMMQLRSGQVKKVDKPGDFSNVLPYMSFYTPDRLLGRPADL